MTGLDQKIFSLSSQRQTRRNWRQDQSVVPTTLITPTDLNVASLSEESTLNTCFKVQLNGPTCSLLSAGVQGTWSSSSDAVLQVDPRSGAAVARDFGTATVYYEIAGVLKTYSEVQCIVKCEPSVMNQPLRSFY